MVNALLLAEKYVKYHFGERDEEKALELLSVDVCMFGTNRAETYRGKQNIFDYFEMLRARQVQNYRVRIVNGENIPQSPDVAVARMMLVVDNGEVQTECRMTVCGRIEQGRECISAIHMSIPHFDDDDRYFPTLTEESLSKMRDSIRKQTEEEKARIAQLEKEEFQLKMIIDEQDILVWEYEFATKRIIRNPQVCMNKGGCQIKENVPESVIEAGVIHPDSVEEYRKLYRRLEAGAKKAAADIRVLHTNGKKWIWQRVVYFNTFENGKPVRAYAVARIVTDEKDRQHNYEKEMSYQESAGRESEVSLRFNLNENQVLEYYIHGQPADKNVTLEEFMDAESDMGARKKDRTKIRRNLMSEKLRAAYERGKNKVQFDYLRMAESGVSRWASCEVHMMPTPQGMDVAGFLYIYDIHQSMMNKLALECITDREVNLMAYYECGDGALHMICGGAFEMNYMIEQVGGTEVIEKAIRADGVFSRIVKQDYEGKKYRFRGYFLSENGNAVVLVANDVTNMVSRDEENNIRLQKLVEEKEKANAAKSDFLSRMSHDLRTPLNGIIGLAELGREEAVQQSTKENYEKIMESGRYLLGLLNDVLDMAKIEQGRVTLNPECVEAESFACNMKSTLTTISRDSDADFRFESHFAERYAMMDVLKIQQVTVNLVNNALKFTPEGGRVECRIEGGKASDGKFEMHIEVNDTGVGMSKEFQSRMFKPFEQENSKADGMLEGTGLGLAIVKSMVELMDGTIRCSSAPGEGTSFCIVLPVQIPDEEAIEDLQRKVEAKPDEGRLENRRILLVEDNALNGEVASRLLQKKGLLVDWVENGEQAVDTFRKSPKGYYDLILMDVQMPIMNGLEATRQIRSLLIDGAKEIPIIAMTANAYEEDIEKSIAAGMNAHLSKPINSSMLFQTLEHWIR